MADPLGHRGSLAAEIYVDRGTPDGLTALAERYQDLYQCTAPAILMGPIKAHLATVEDLLGSALPRRERLRLLSNCGQVAQLAGRLTFFDLQGRYGARAYFLASYDAAVAAGDSALAAAALGHLAFVPAATGQWSAAEDHLAHARAYAARGSSPQLRSWLAAVRSEVTANAGDRSGTLSAVDEATTLLEGARDRHEAPGWFDFYDRTRLAGSRVTWR